VQYTYRNSTYWYMRSMKLLP